MILNEAVTLLGYKVDERELRRYQQQLRQQEKEALKLLRDREKNHAKAEADKLRALERSAREQARIADRLARSQQREYDRSVRAHERMLTAQIRAAERAARQELRIKERAVRDLQRASGMGGGGGLGMLGGVVGVGSLMAGAKSVYDTGTTRESMMTGLKNLPGMTDASALSQFKALEKFNLQTPYTLDEIIQGYIRLKNVGLDASQRAMEAYGGIAAAIPGKKINDFVEAVADGVMGQGRRLKEFGIDLSMEGDKAAISFRGQTIRVGRDAKSIEKALQDISFKHFGKTMAEMAKTTGGQMSNLSDQFDNLKWQIWNGGMKSAVQGLIKGSSDLLKQWTPLTREFAIFARLNLPSISRSLADGLKLVGVAMGVLMAKTVGQSYLAMIKNIGLLSTSFKTLGASAFFAESGLAAIAKGGVIIMLAAVLADFVYYLNTGDSALVRFTGRWPKLSAAIKDGYYWNKVFIEAVSIGYQKIYIKVNDIYQKTKLWFDHIKKEIGNPLILKFLNALAGSNPIVGGVVNLLGGSSDPNGGTAGSGGGGFQNAVGGGRYATPGNIGMTARNFQSGGVGKSAADLWAKSNLSLSGFKVKDLYIEGNACAISTEKVVADAGGTKALLDKMNASVPETYNMLKNSGMVEFVTKDQLTGNNELFFSPTLTHIGVVGPGGNSLIHASTQAGRDTRGQLGFKQRYQETPNYLGGNGIYMRIKPQFMNGTMPAPNAPFQTSSASVQLNQNFYGQTDPRKAGSAAQTGVQSGLNRVQIGLPTYTNGIA
jgi:flagellar biosynthesis GTPase FlhF